MLAEWADTAEWFIGGGYAAPALPPALDAMLLLYAIVSVPGCGNETADPVGCGIDDVSRLRVPTRFLAPPATRHHHYGK